MNSTDRRRLDGLHRTRRPADDYFLDLRVRTEAEVQAALVLGAVAAGAGHFLHLLLTVPVQPYLRADGASIAGGSFEFEGNPRVLGRDVVLVDQQRPALVGDHHIEHASI